MDPGAESPAYFDVVIVGAGLSGINAAYRLLTTFPECSFTVLEARSCLGGTWSFWVSENHTSRDLVIHYRL